MNEDNPVAKTTISTLPDEILALVFFWVCHQNTCMAQNRPKNVTKFPATLTLVCSRWKQLVDDMPIIQSHIDLSLISERKPDLEPINTKLTMAKQSPLDLHVTYRRASGPCGDAFEALCNILDRVVPRMRSLTLDYKSSAVDVLHEVMNRCLGNDVPGTLKELNIIILGDNDSSWGFIQAGDPRRALGAARLTEDRLESVLGPITTLRLCGAFLHWTSSAYSGLVELSLHSNQNGSRALKISQPDLWAVLLSSPDLQVLDLAIELTDVPETPPVPIHLRSLQVLRTGSMTRYQYRYLMGSLFPGSVPLALCCRGYVDAGDFLARTNVERIWIEYVTSFSTLKGIDPAPHIRALALSRLYLHSVPTEQRRQELDYNREPRRINTLYLLSPCIIDISNLEYIVRYFQVQKLLIDRECRLIQDGPQASGVTVEEHVSGICPDFEWLRTDQPPGWGVPLFPRRV